MTASGAFRILLVTGSTRSGSTNTAALRTVQAVSGDSVTAVLYEGLAYLPAFNPDEDYEPLHPAVADLRQEIARSDAVLFCTPEYAGALPGSFKNLLDWTVGGGEIYGKPAAWINVAAEGRGANAEASLATVLRYVGADIINGACMRIPVARYAIGPDGLVADATFRRRVEELLQSIVHHLEVSRALSESGE
ncbi:MAG: NADPH-dependent FMN reductase [Acidimicrobiales bacterium]